MFTPAGRDRLLAELVSRARGDDLVTAAALVGSGARHDTDQWSDLDLALRLSSGVDLTSVASRWSDHLAAVADVAAVLDVWAGPTLYRVFLLQDSLQVDLSFWPDASFGSNGEAFELLFGEANAAAPPVAVDRTDLLGWAWLHALHVRSALARGRPWQALQLLDGLLERLVSLACLRHELPAAQGRGVDRLPAPELAALATARAVGPDLAALRRAFAAAVRLLLVEAQHVDPALATRLRDPLATLVATAG